MIAVIDKDIERYLMSCTAIDLELCILKYYTYMCQYMLTYYILQIKFE